MAGGAGTMGFERGADGFDGRAEIPASAFAALASHLVDVGVPEGGVWLDVGAGTGQLASALAPRASRYLALDRSPAMLRVLHERALGARLLLADADCGWPVAGGSLAGVCLLRVAHLLDPGRLQSELRRTCHASAWVLLLRRRRDPSSARERLRREMRQRVARLRGEGDREDGRGAHERAARCVASACGGEAAEIAVAHWQSATSAAAMLASWHGKDGLAGRSLEACHKRALLNDLERWARRELGDLDQPSSCPETLCLQAFRMERPKNG